MSFSSRKKTNISSKKRLTARKRPDLRNDGLVYWYPITKHFTSHYCDCVKQSHNNRRVPFQIMQLSFRKESMEFVYRDSEIVFFIQIIYTFDEFPKYNVAIY